MSPVANDKIASHTTVKLRGTVRRVSDLALVDVTGATIALRYSINGGSWVEITPVTILDGPAARLEQEISDTILSVYVVNGDFRYEWRGLLSDGTEMASLELETLRVRAKPI